MKRTIPQVAEIISIGDEMTSGQRLDTNSQWLSQQLEALGLRVMFHTTVGDDLNANIHVFRNAVQRADIIVSTGGLGPTQDDLTREAIAVAFGKTLELRQEALLHIESLFRARSRTMPERNQVQAMFPSDSQIIPNPHGTAPGIDLTVPRTPESAARIFSLPGVPAEMFEMWRGTVRDSIQAMMTGGPVVRSAIIKCFGCGESEMESYIPELIAREHQPAVGITVNRATISLRIRAEAPTEVGAINQIEQTRREIYQRVGPWIFGEGEECELQHAVAGLLEAAQQTICTLEIGWDNLLAQAFAQLERPQLFCGGLTSPTEGGSLAPLLKLPAEAPFVEVAEAYRTSVGANWLLGIDRYPPILAAQKNQSHSVTLWALGDSLDQPLSQTIQLAGHPDIVRYRIAKTALNWFRKGLLASWT